MTCLCIDDLRPASFRGAAFFVASDKGEYGRRDIVHEYPMRDDPYVEDMGQKATRYSVSGYLAGDDWISRKNALVAACTARGPAILQLPTEAPAMVACLSLNVSRSKDACGFYAVTMEFVKAKNFGVPAAVAVIESQIGRLIHQVAGPLTRAFDQAYRVAAVAPYVSGNQIDRIVAFTSMAIDTVESHPVVDDDIAADVVRLSVGAYQNVAAYASADREAAAALVAQPEVTAVVARLATQSGYVRVAESGVTIKHAGSAIVPVVAAIIDGIGNAMLPADASTALLELARWTYRETSPAALSGRRLPGVTAASSPVAPSDLADAANGAAFCGVVRSFALMKLAQAISARSFADRAEAIRARATVVELFNAQIEQFDEDEIVNTMLEARDLAVRSVTQRMATLVPVVTVDAPQSRPSLYWAARLYATLDRAEELAERNGVVNPAFMPTSFEALAN